MADTYAMDEADDEFNTKKPLKSVRLSLHLIVKRHLPPDGCEWSQEKIIEELNKIRRVRLDRENVGEIDSMELLSNEVSNLYLQCNQIRRIENLECLPNLQVLVLSQNQIQDVGGLLHLQRLLFLDLSENKIAHVDPESFPKSLIILDLKENPCTEAEYHRDKFQMALPKLKQLDGVDLYDEEGDLTEDSDDDMSDTLDDDVLNSENQRRPLSFDSLYRQLPKIEMSISDMTTEILMRSQQRMEERNDEHKRLVQEVTNIKIKTKIKPHPQIPKQQ